MRQHSQVIDQQIARFMERKSRQFKGLSDHKVRQPKERKQFVSTAITQIVAGRHQRLIGAS